MPPKPLTSITTALTQLSPKFAAARKSGAVFFFESEVELVEGEGEDEVDFQVRICPALQNKHKSVSEKVAAVSKSDSSSTRDLETEEVNGKSSPFEPPYIEDLHVGDVDCGLEGEEGMAVLLNKYTVVPEHFLLVTKTAAPQHLPPTPPQLLTMYNILLSSIEHRSSSRRLLAFYNGGKGAGASQTWRHAQFVEVDGRRGAPVESWVKGLEVERKDKPFVHPNLPYLHILHQLPPSTSQPFPPTPESNSKMLMTLASAMMGCLDLMFDCLRRGGAGRDGGWNLLMTLDHVHLIPRSHPSFPVPGSTDLEVNSLGYAGMVLCKSKEELEALKRATTVEGASSDSTKGLMGILQHCGVPREWSEEVPNLEGAVEANSYEAEGPSVVLAEEGDGEDEVAVTDSSV